MNGRDLLNAMGHVEERYVDEAEYGKLRKPLPLGWLSAAACLCILIGGAALLLRPAYSNDGAAMPEFNGSRAECDVAETLDRVTQDSAQGEMGMELPNAEIPSVTLRIDAWNDGSITATVCDAEADAEQLPLGQEVTVLFDEQIRTDREWRMPTEEDFPVGSYVIVLFHSYTEEDGAVSIVMTGITRADPAPTP